MSLQTVLTQAILDGAVALYMLYLWQKEIGQQRQCSMPARIRRTGHPSGDLDDILRYAREVSSSSSIKEAFPELFDVVS